MVEVQGLQGISTSEVSGSVGVLNTDSVAQNKDDQVKFKAADEDTSDDTVAVDLSTMVNTKTADNSDSLPDLMKAEPNKSFVSKADLAAARLRVQATDGEVPASSADQSSNSNPG